MLALVCRGHCPDASVPRFLDFCPKQLPILLVLTPFELGCEVVEFGLAAEGLTVIIFESRLVDVLCRLDVVADSEIVIFVTF